MLGCVSGADDLELRAAEMAATGGPVFDVGLAAAERVDLVLHEFDLGGIRHVVRGDMVVVHHNDRDRARAAVSELLGDGYELPETAQVGVEVPFEPARLVVAYTAGDLVQAELIRARLRSEGIESRLRYDPTTTMARHLAYDRTVKVLVDEAEAELASDVLGGIDLDTGNGSEFRSKAWATPMRRVGSTALLIYAGLTLGAILILAALRLWAAL